MSSHGKPPSDFLSRAETALREKLELKEGSKDVLRNRESTLLEFKKSFSIGSLGLYSRSVCAFANNRGGYIVFGVMNHPHKIVGIDERIESVDPARIADHFKQHLAPEVNWWLDTFTAFGIRLGYLAVEPAADRPVMAIRDSGKDFRRDTIYYRYHGQSAQIQYSELRGLLQERVEREREAWMRHLARINEAGPTNVGILDASSGRLHGFGTTFIVDEDLVRKIHFIESGRFSETEGEPTLRLIGDVQTTAGTILERPIETGIHADDIISAFLTQRPLSPQEARNYLRETLHQTSPLIPFLFLLPMSGLSREEAAQLLKDESGSHRQVKERVLARLRGDRIAAFGAPPEQEKEALPEDPGDFLALLKTESQPRRQRDLLFTALLSRPDLLVKTIQELPINRLSEAVSHLPKAELTASTTQTLAVLKAAYDERLKELPSPIQSFLRRAIAFVDQSLHRVED